MSPSKDCFTSEDIFDALADSWEPIQDRAQPDDCMIWRGDFDKHGIPRIEFTGRRWAVRQLVTTAETCGLYSVPETVASRCEDPRCVNFFHFNDEVAAEIAALADATDKLPRMLTDAIVREKVWKCVTAQ